MWVAELWRYPVKSMRGERLQEARLTGDGVAGDRLVHVAGAHGVLTARTRPGLLGLSATLRDDGVALVDGRPWWEPSVGAAVEAAAGADAELVPHDGLDRFDILPLLVATDGAIAAFGRDGRRLRPNLVVGGVDGLSEREWEGRRIRVGAAAEIHLDSLRGRCIMTTFDPDDPAAQDVEVLLDIRRRFAGTLALNAAVTRPGAVRVGDPVVLL